MNSQEILSQLVAAIREECIAEITQTLTGVRGKANGAPARKKATKAKSAPMRRDPKAMEKLVQSLKTYIERHPGENMEQIGAGMGHATRELKLPMRKLLDEKVVTRKGDRRAARYTIKG